MEQLDRPIIVRKEHYGWLIFNRTSGSIIKVSNSFFAKNIKRSGLRVIRNPLVPNALSAPLKVFLDVSNICNICCVHCLSYSNPTNTESISIDLACKVIEECSKIGVFMLKIGGGEPFLYPHLLSLIKFASSCDLNISLTTNGTIVHNDILESLYSHNVAVSLSIDGDERIHDSIRGNGVYRSAIQTLKIMIAVGLTPTLQFTLMPQNIDVINHVILLAKYHGVRLKIRRAKPSGRSIGNQNVLLNTSDKYANLLRLINEEPICDIEDIMSFTATPRNTILTSKFDCGAARRSIHINYNGDISPCVFIENEFVDGNIAHNSILSQWSNGKYMKMIRSIIPNTECAICDRANICHGECLAIRKYTSGSMNGLDPLCPKRAGVTL